jgi:hypothetical protein
MALESSCVVGLMVHMLEQGLLPFYIFLFLWEERGGKKSNFEIISIAALKRSDCLKQNAILKIQHVMILSN